MSKRSVTELDRLSKEKSKVIDRLLHDEFVLVHLRTKTPGVLLPPHLLQSATVTLKISRLFRGALELLKEEIRAELLFDKSYFECRIPWKAIWGVTSCKGALHEWSDSASARAEPLAALAKVLDECETADTSEEAEKSAPVVEKPEKGSRPVLRRIK